MSSNTATSSGISGNARYTIYANRQAWTAYLLAIVIFPPFSVFCAMLFGVIDYWGWLGGIGGVLLAMSFVLIGFSFVAYTSVKIKPGTVILRSPIWRTTIRSTEVTWVKLDPPLNSLRMDWSWWKRDSQCVIYRRTKHQMNVSFMPDGLKRRIAQTLDPAHWPPLPEPQQK